MSRLQDHIIWRLEQWHQQALHRRLGHLGEGSKLDATCVVYSPERLSVGDRSVINNYSVIFALGGVTIGDDVLISASCNISTVTHPTDAAERHSMRTMQQSVVVEDGAWIGTNAVILPGVRVGRNAIVGAGAVVTKDVEADTIVVGVPARPLERHPSER